MNKRFSNQDKEEDERKGFLDPSYLRAYAMYGGLVFQLVATIVICLLGGRYLDERLDTAPLFLVVGLILGTVGGFYNFFRLLNQFQKRRNKE